MPRIAKSAATLRIFGDDLIPEHVTSLLGASPTSSHRKGEIKRFRSGKELVRKTGMWQLEAPDREPENLDAQVHELLARLPPDFAVWKGLSERYTIDLFCGLFMAETNEGLSLSPSTLSALGERGIQIDLDVYAPTREIALDESCPCGSGVPYGECCAPRGEA